MRWVVFHALVALVIHGSSIAPAAEAMGSRLHMVADVPHWFVEEAPPGTTVYLPGVAHFVVAGREPWDLNVESALVARDGGPVYSRVVPRWVVAEDAGASPLEGQRVRIDLELMPSWDDPPGRDYDVQVDVVLSSEAAMVASYVTPPQWEEGYSGPVVVWYHRSEIPAQNNDLVFVVRHGETGHVHVEATVDPPTATGWHSFEVPVANLTPGTYAYALYDGDNQLVAAGDFRVRVPGEGMGDLDGVAFQAADGLASGLLSVPGKGSTPSIQPAASGLKQRPQATLQVDPKRSPPGEPAQWLVRIFNPGLFSLLDASLYLCLPSGWHVTGADVPVIGAQRDGAWCQRLLLGAVSGRSQRTVNFSVMQWPPQQRTPFALEAEAILDVYLYVGSPDGGEPQLLRWVRVPLESSERSMSPTYSVSGVVFIDEDGDGHRGSGESGAGGVQIVVNGQVVRTSSRTGAFTVHLPVGYHAVWARSSRGKSRPVTLYVDGPGSPRLFLPLSPALVDSPESSSFPEIAADHVVDYYLRSTVRGGAGRVQHETSLRGLHLGAWGDVDWEVSPTAMEGRAVLRGETHRWEGQWRQGVPQRVRMGSLRPSMPAQSAWRLGLHVPPYMYPTEIPTVVATSIEVSEAFDNFWYCRVWWSGLDWSSGSTRFSANGVRAEHSRWDEYGVRSEVARQVSVEGTGAAPSLGEGWRYSWSFAHGQRRRLSPSCGYTPADGTHWRVGLYPPLFPLESEPVIEQVGLASSRWSSGGRAVEFSLESVPFRLVELLGGTSGNGDADAATIQLIPAIQWGSDGGTDGSGDDAGWWTRPGLAIRTRLGAHRVEVQWGYRPLAETSRELDVDRAEARRYVQWQWDGGRIGWLAGVEVQGQGDALRRASEVGLLVRDPLSRESRIGSLLGLKNSRLELRRSHSATRMRDEVRVDVTTGGYTLRLRASGRTPRRPADALVTSWVSYETRDARLSVEGRTSLPAWLDRWLRDWIELDTVRWTASMERNDSPEEVTRHESFGLRGQWHRAVGVPASGRTVDSRAFSGDWGVELGRQGTARIGEAEAALVLKALATCRCRHWHVEAEVRRVLRATEPVDIPSSAPPVAMARIHASRPLAATVAGFVEMAWSQMGLDSRGPAITVGVEAVPFEGIPTIVGAGLRFGPGGEASSPSTPQWVLQVRTPLFAGVE